MCLFDQDEAARVRVRVVIRGFVVKVRVRVRVGVRVRVTVRAGDLFFFQGLNPVQFWCD